MSREESVDLNKKGIEFKRQGDFEKALDYYIQAMVIDNSNKSSYNNIYRVLIGMDKPKNALKFIFAFKHIDWLEVDKNSYELMEKMPWEEMYIWNEPINQSGPLGKFQNDFVFSKVKEQPLFLIIAADMNTCFNTAVAMCLAEPSVVDAYDIPFDLLKSYQKFLLGIPGHEENIRTSKYENLMNIIGFMILTYSLKLREKVSTSEAPHLYFQED